MGGPGSGPSDGNMNASKHGLYAMIRSGEFPRCKHCPAYIKSACDHYDEESPRCELILGWIDKEVQDLMKMNHLDLVRDRMIIERLVKTRYLVHYLEHRIAYEDLLIITTKEGRSLSGIWEKKMALERHLLQMMAMVGLAPAAWKALFGEIPRIPAKEKERWLEECAAQTMIPGMKASADSAD